MNLTDVNELRGLLRRHGWQPQQALGQHFLVSKPVVEAIAGRLQSVQGLLEIGPGPGVLTSHLLKAGHPVTAIEIDPLAVAALTESAPKATVLHQDALDADLPALLRDLPPPVGLVSNLPYHLTGPLLDRILRAKDSWSIAVLMMQREVGERILAPVGNRERGGLSLRVQYGFQVQRVITAPGGAFYPPPKVESIVLQFTAIPGRSLDSARERLWAAACAQPRKTLLNNLQARYDRDTVGRVLRRQGLTLDVRPHEVPDVAWDALLVELEPEP